ncbi:unnamed protein product [Pylaiella littoralis]
MSRQKENDGQAFIGNVGAKCKVGERERERECACACVRLCLCLCLCSCGLALAAVIPVLLTVGAADVLLFQVVRRCIYFTIPGSAVLLKYSRSLKRHCCALRVPGFFFVRSCRLVCNHSSVVRPLNFG